MRTTHVVSAAGFLVATVHCGPLLGVDFDGVSAARDDAGVASGSADPVRSDGAPARPSDGAPAGGAPADGVHAVADAASGDDVDGSTVCAASPCRMTAPQCGCASGQGCYPGASGAPTCLPAGSGDESSPCTQLVDCRPGLVCVEASPTARHCGRICETDGDCGRPGSTCFVNGSFSLCSAGCDPVADTGCPAGTMCAVVNPPGEKVTLCSAVGTVLPSRACDAVSTCIPGYTCFGGACVKICRPGVPGNCPAATTCRSVQKVDGVSLGVCTFG